MTYPTETQFPPLPEEPLPVTMWQNSAGYKYRATYKTANGVTVTAQSDSTEQVMNDLKALIQLAAVATGTPIQVTSNGGYSPMVPTDTTSTTTQQGPWSPPPLATSAPPAPFPAPPSAALWPAPGQPMPTTGEPPPGSLHPTAVCQHGQPYVYRSGIARATGRPYQGYYCPLPQGQSCAPYRGL